MSDDDFDDEFWTTYIAATPDEDKDFRGCGRWLLILLAGAGFFWLLAEVVLP